MRGEIRIIKHALVFAAICNNRIPEVPFPP